MNFIGSVSVGIFLFLSSIIGGVFGVFTHAPAPASNSLTVETTTTTASGAQPVSQSGTGVSSNSQTSGSVTSGTQTTSVQTNAGANISGTVYTNAQLLAMAGSVATTALPLGDGKYVTSAPKQGYVYLCHVMSGGGGSQVNGPWIGSTTWNSASKIAVQGSTSWPTAYITISVSGSTRTIATNDLPTVGTTGTFPIQSTDPAYKYDSNPNSVQAQDFTFALPASPTVLETPNCINGEVGVMTNGVLLLDGFDELYHDAAAHELQDSCDGHPHEGGVYHYHSLSPCIPDATETNVIGWAFDGFPITGPEVAPGKYLTSADLDECHGLTSTIDINGQNVTTYHYVMTADFPYSVSCFRGKSYEPGPDGQSGTSVSTQSSTSNISQTQGQTPPQAAIDACSGETSGSCSFSAPNGTISGTCKAIPSGTVACVPN